MSSSVRISERLFQAAYQKGKIECRSTAKQIEYWAEIGRTVERHAGLTAMDLLQISSGAKTLIIEEMDVSNISSSTILELIEQDKASGDFQKDILKNGPIYQRCLTNTNYLEQIHPDGSTKIGNFVDGCFVKKT
ncbi:TA system antitoxin ParD family protein [Terasakiella pusilla]|uniref:TA system antitoxin ParD family protein n=1 Tax=Terasakiella pusilla TaxID=64973 RepID=UPI000570F570|nr:hypothetical protein [Terasakiella pusilla]